MNFLLRWLSCSVAVAAALWITPGIYLPPSESAWGAAIGIALILALINASLKPILQVLSLPISVITLGIFALVINALMFELAGWIASGLFGIDLVISSFAAAFLASIIVSIVSMLVNRFIGLD